MLSERFFRPAKRPDQMEPDDCPACKGAGGHYRQTGCMGGHESVKCDCCHGKGKLSKERQRFLKAREQLENFSKTERNVRADITNAAMSWHKAKGKKKDAAIVKLEAACLEGEALNKDFRKAVTEYEEAESAMSFEDRFGK